jgi:acyl-ACP thioesterase
MTEWPSHGENVNITTWLRPPEGAFVTREFLIKNEDGRLLGSCSTSWLALDRESKKILPIANIRDWTDITSEQSTGISAEKVPAEGVFENVAKYRVRVSDLDINQHVNNTKYSQWILDSIPYELHKVLLLKAYSVNFLAETHLGDEVRIERKASTKLSQEASSGQTIYRGLRVSDDRVLFTAALSWEKKI